MKIQHFNQFEFERWEDENGIYIFSCKRPENSRYAEFNSLRDFALACDLIEFRDLAFYQRESWKRKYTLDKRRADFEQTWTAKSSLDEGAFLSKLGEFCMGDYPVDKIDISNEGHIREAYLLNDEWNDISVIGSFGKIWYLFHWITLA